MTNEIMFTHNVFVREWGTRAGYGSEAEADDAARNLVLEHGGVSAFVEDAERDVVLHGYTCGRDEDGDDEATRLDADGGFAAA
jgi:hypothetical protein